MKNINSEIDKYSKLVEKALDKYIEVEDENSKALFKQVATLIRDRSNNGVNISNVEILYNKRINEDVLGNLVENMFKYIQIVFSVDGYIEVSSEYRKDKKNWETVVNVKFEPFTEEDDGVEGYLPPNVIPFSSLN